MNFGIRLMLIFSLILGVVVTGSGQKQTDMDVVESRIRKLVLTSRVKEDVIEKLMNTLRSDSTWPGINYADTTKTGFQAFVHMENLLTLSIAYQKEGNRFYHSKDVLNCIRKALGHWVRFDYRCENWWWNEIGIPDLMTQVLILIRKELDGPTFGAAIKIAERASLTGFGARPGGDFVKIAAIKASADISRGDTASFAHCVQKIGEQVYVAGGNERGIKPDMSFHHRLDAVPSTLAYGLDYTVFFCRWAYAVHGTKYAFDEKTVRLMVDYFVDGIQKALAFGVFDDPGIKNREMTRSQAAHYRSDKVPPLLVAVTDYRRDELLNPRLRTNQYFWFSHYHTHQRPSYFASVRMYSSRSKNIEYPYNGEGLKNHFFADGSLLLTRSKKEFLNILPAWDWRKIPGTTVVQVEPFLDWDDMVRDGKTSFVGGVSDGEYGAACFDFISPYSDLQAKKSWFFFDEEIVCLGSGISTSLGAPVVTTINQVRRNGPIQVDAHPINDTGSLKLRAPIWVNHDSVGYVVLGDQNLVLKNGKASGSWYDINHQESKTMQPVEVNLFTLTVEHGINPRDESYSYIVLPAAGVGKTAAYAAAPRVKIVENSDTLQSVSHRTNGIHYAIFYKPGMLVFENGITLETDQPALYMVKMHGRKLERITIADPTRSLNTVSFRLYGPGISVDRTIVLPDGDMAGKSIRVPF